jgi:hypothetical protein
MRIAATRLEALHRTRPSGEYFSSDFRQLYLGAGARAGCTIKQRPYAETVLTAVEVRTNNDSTRRVDDFDCILAVASTPHLTSEYETEDCEGGGRE